MGLPVEGIKANFALKQGGRVLKWALRGRLSTLIGLDMDVELRASHF